ncbi:hypothetical protein [Sphingobacterium sp.]|uniref:hypothetical protein n=1 Tax=Sphingobacterium sp. TaxID=341027 RepID=UPI00258C7305|nr:hypothetical protein [Sphingobacterium sp.]WET67041.1 MAG: hypothetical protein P0Y57_14495 [Sphingobacterium sp.]
MMKRIPYIITVLLFSLLLFSLIACKKELVPVAIENNAAGKINYYSTSEVLKQFSDQLFGIGIFTDTVANDLRPINSVTVDNTPYLTYIPRKSTLIEYPVVIGQVTPSYLSYSIGKHRLNFTLMKSNSQGIVKLPDITYAQSEVNLSFDNKVLVYLIDAPPQELDKPKFNVIIMQQPERPKIEIGFVRLRILNASPDAGELSISLVKADGSVIKTELPQHLAYGEFTQEIPLNLLDALSNKLLKLKITDQNGKLLLYSGIPAIQQHGYTLIIKGFYTTHKLNVPSRLEKDATGTIIYAPVDLPISLAADIRQTY